MTAYGILEPCLRKTMFWISGLQESRNIETDEEALAVFHAVLRNLRDYLTMEESARLAAQLPLIIRGIYYEDWEPEKSCVCGDAAAFERNVQQSLEDLNLKVKAGVAIPLVFELLSRQITPGIIRRIKSALPPGINEFWPQRQAA